MTDKVLLLLRIFTVEVTEGAFSKVTSLPPLSGPHVSRGGIGCHVDHQPTQVLFCRVNDTLDSDTSVEDRPGEVLPLVPLRCGPTSDSKGDWIPSTSPSRIRNTPFGVRELQEKLHFAEVEEGALSTKGTIQEVPTEETLRRVDDIQIPDLNIPRRILTFDGDYGYDSSNEKGPSHLKTGHMLVNRRVLSVVTFS